MYYTKVMSIVKKHLILHTFENIRPYHSPRDEGYVINNVYPSVVPPNDVHLYTRNFKILVENTCNKGIVYVEWLVRKNDKLKRFNLFK